MLSLGLMYRPHCGEESIGVLIVRIISAKLPMCVDSFVTLKLLPDKTKETTVVKQSMFNPVWDEIFLFQNVSLANLKTCNVLQVTLSHCSGKANIKTGFLQLGPTSSGEGKHWKDILENPGLEVKMEHVLGPYLKRDARKRNDEGCIAARKVIDINLEFHRTHIYTQGHIAIT